MRCPKVFLSQSDLAVVLACVRSKVGDDERKIEELKKIGEDVGSLEQRWLRLRKIRDYMTHSLVRDVAMYGDGAPECTEELY